MRPHEVRRPRGGNGAYAAAASSLEGSRPGFGSTTTAATAAIASSSAGSRNHSAAGRGDGCADAGATRITPDAFGAGAGCGGAAEVPPLPPEAPPPLTV